MRGGQLIEKSDIKKIKIHFFGFNNIMILKDHFSSICFFENNQIEI